MSVMDGADFARVRDHTQKRTLKSCGRKLGGERGAEELLKRARAALLRWNAMNPAMTARGFRGLGDQAVCWEMMVGQADGAPAAALIQHTDAPSWPCFFRQRRSHNQRFPAYRRRRATKFGTCRFLFINPFAFVIQTLPGVLSRAQLRGRLRHDTRGSPIKRRGSTFVGQLSCGTFRRGGPGLLEIAARQP